MRWPARPKLPCVAQQPLGMWNGVRGETPFLIADLASTRKISSNLDFRNNRRPARQHMYMNMYYSSAWVP